MTNFFVVLERYLNDQFLCCSGAVLELPISLLFRSVTSVCFTRADKVVSGSDDRSVKVSPFHCRVLFCKVARNNIQISDILIIYS